MQQLLVGQGNFSFEASRSHSVCPSGLVISLTQIPVLDNTRQSEGTTLHAPDGFEPTIPKKRAVADPRLITHGYSDPLKCVYLLEYAYPLMLTSFVFAVIYFKVQ